MTLLERESQLARLGELLADARRGRGGLALLAHIRAGTLIEPQLAATFPAAS